MFIVVDLETTAREPEQAHVVEWAYEILSLDGKRLMGNYGLVKPPVPIPPETSAVHHIIDADVAEALPWAAAADSLRHVIAATKPVALVAHNSSFERHFLAELAPDVPWICTYKAALRVWPDAPGHSNEALRYWLGGPALGRQFPQAAHSARHDTLVTADLLLKLLQHASIDQFIQWEREPALLPRCPIGQYRNLPWAEVPTDWLEWALYKAVDMRADVVHCAKSELVRRFPPGQQTGA